MNRCSKCGTEGKNGKLACQCTNGRLEVSGYRCPNCLRDGGEEMLAGRIACPYCFHAFETPAPPVPKSPAAISAASQSPTPQPSAPQPSASNPLFPFRRWSEIAALCLVAGVMAAAAYKYGLPLIHRWLEPAKTASPSPQSSDEPPGKQKPSAGHGAEPQQPEQQPPISQVPGQGVVTVQPPDGINPPSEVTPATIASFTASAQSIQRGSSTTLHWQVTGDNPTVSLLPGIGAVPPTGTWEVSPQATQQYTLTAINSGESTPQIRSIVIVVIQPYSSYGRDSQAIELLSAVQNAMGGKRNLEAIHGWQRSERVTWEFNGGTTLQTTTFIVPSEIRIEAQGNNTTVDFSNGVAGWSWSSTSPVRSSLPPQTATGLPFRELPALLLSDNDPQRTITVAGPSTLVITDKHNDRVFLKVDPSSHLPQTITWLNLDGSELEETYSDWRQSAGVMWWGHRMRSRNHQEFFRADVTSLQLK